MPAKRPSPAVTQANCGSISAVIPVYNEESVLPELVARVCAALADISPNHELILVDDGSRDGSVALMRAAAEANPRVRVLELSRNFGHQKALTAGLQAARGDVIAILDGDLQDPPELLPAMVARMGEGYDVVYGVRQARQEHWPKRLSYWTFYRLLDFIAEVRIPLDSGDFCVMSRQVLDVMNGMRERHRFLRGLRSWVGFRQCPFPYQRPGRAAGEPKFTLAKLAALALDGVFTMSEKPLRIASTAGILIAFLSLVAAARILYWRLFTDDGLIGYASVAVGIFFMGGVQLIAIGILGEYVGRIHNEIKDRPQFVLRATHGSGLAAPATVDTPAAAS